MQNDNTLTQEQIAFFRENGFLRLEHVYFPEELRAMSEELNYITQTFATWGAWKGPWRKEYVRPKVEGVEVNVYGNWTPSQPAPVPKE